MNKTVVINRPSFKICTRFRETFCKNSVLSYSHSLQRKCPWRITGLDLSIQYSWLNPTGALDNRVSILWTLANQIFCPVLEEDLDGALGGEMREGQREREVESSSSPKAHGKCNWKVNQTESAGDRIRDIGISQSWVWITSTTLWMCEIDYDWSCLWDSVSLCVEWS